MLTQDQVNLNFIAYKGFDIHSAVGLQKALTWLQTTGADNLMYGNPAGDSFDITVGEMRRPMLIASVEAAIKETII